MTDKPENPSAFASNAVCAEGQVFQKGMTLRDYAVIHYSAALIGSVDFMIEANATCGTPEEVSDALTFTAACFADAMLKERAKP